MIDYNKFKNIQKKVPTITDLDGGLTKRKTRNEGKTFSIFLFLVTVLGIAYFFSYDTLSSLIPIGGFYLTAFAVIFILFISSYISLLIGSNITEKIRDKSYNQGSNSKFSLNKVWRIPSGGLTESIPLKTKFYKGNTMSIKYDNDAIIVKCLMDSVLDIDNDGDIKHYLTYTKIVDLIMKYNYELEVISLRYNPDNDNIWNDTSRKIALASSLGNNYTLIRSALENRLYTFTKDYSTVDAQYLIIKSTPFTDTSPAQLLNILMTYVGHSRLKVYGIDTQEFKAFLEQYYAISIAIEDITEYITSTNLPFETKVLGYTLDNKYTTVNEPYKYVIPNSITTLGGYSKSTTKNKNNLKSEIEKEENKRIENERRQTEYEFLRKNIDRTFEEW